MAERDGLGALQVGVAGHPPVAVLRRRARAASPRTVAEQARSRPPLRSATNSARSVATWSLRERPVWSLPPSGPTISVSRRSIAMWMSSSAVLEREGSPSSSSRSTASRPAEQPLQLLGRRARRRRAAPGRGRASRARRRAPGGDRTSSEALSRQKTGSGSCSKRGMRRQSRVSCEATGRADARSSHRRHRQDRQRRRPAAWPSAATRSSPSSATPRGRAELLPDGGRAGARRRHRSRVAATAPPRAPRRRSTAWGSSSSGPRDPDVFNRVNAERRPQRRQGRARGRSAAARPHLHLRRLPRAPRRHRQRGRASPTTRRARPTSAPSSSPSGSSSAEARARDRGRDRQPGAIIGPGPWAEAGFDPTLRDVIRGRLPVVPPGGMTPDLGRRRRRRPHRRARPRPAGERYIVAGGFATVREICAAARSRRRPRPRARGRCPSGVARGLAGVGETRRQR